MKLAIAIGSRANYASIKAVTKLIEQDTDIESYIFCFASAVLEKYGSVYKQIQLDGLTVNRCIETSLNSERLSSMAQSTGLATMKIADYLEEIQPDAVITVGDRFETIATVIAAAYQNIRVAHTMGGEVTGTIDESIRHAITKFSHYHFVASEDAYNRVLKMGEIEASIFNVGCPRMDEVRIILENIDSVEQEFDGVGDYIDTSKPFLLVSQHPVTTEFDLNEHYAELLLNSLEEIKLPTFILWPNEDAGGEQISRSIRRFRDQSRKFPVRFVKNLPMSQYIYLMKKTSCMIGNSSSGIREGAFIGTPFINLGSRQQGRQFGRNTSLVQMTDKRLTYHIEEKLNSKYEPDFIYGDGFASERIVNVLKTYSPEIQKRISY